MSQEHEREKEKKEYGERLIISFSLFFPFNS